jgi:diguanylate cyclase (GGDEF)-like protein
MRTITQRPMAGTGKPIRLLLVDDDDVDREKFRRLLNRSGLEAQVEEAASGLEALACLRKSMFDCVIVDYRLGDTTGTELARTIKQTNGRAVPIIMITGHGDERVAVEAMREGVYDYLSKGQLRAEHILSAIEGSLHWAELEATLANTQERLRRLSLFDSLTGLPNRNLFCQRGGGPFSLMMMDLNLFKEINDTRGHAAGDKVLAQIGARLSHLARSSDTYARIGGDEFAALLSGCESGAHAIVVADKVHAALQEPLIIDDEVVRVTVSIGAALFPEHGDDSRTLLAHADQAMYRAKRSSRSCEVYSAGVHEGRAFLVANYLPDALERHELFLEYQPKLDLASGALVGVEALVRWDSPQLGLVAPNDFIPTAERTLLIKPLTYAILEMALDQSALWRDQGCDIPMAVNLSARMFDDAELTARCCSALAARSIKPDRLTLEITETALMTSPLRAQETLLSLHNAGIAISIDDFGAGYTSLKYLRDFEISEIKIDKLFITGLQADSRDASIVRSIAALSVGFKLKLVAEGIEDESQCRLLHELGCGFGQGFALGRPMLADRLAGWQTTRASMRAPNQTQRV